MCRPSLPAVRMRRVSAEENCPERGGYNANMKIICAPDSFKGSLCAIEVAAAIGAGATNQAIKAVAIARDYLAPNGIDIVCVPAFIDVIIANEERTAIRLVIEPRR